MFDLSSVKTSVSIKLLRAHLCTLAIALGFNSLWRVPKDAFRYGGLQFLLIHSAAMIIVALPMTLLQLAAGQLSQQDAVGMWRAVPFFKGVGYLRLVISFVGSIHSLIYVALTATYFLYSLSNPMPLLQCMELEGKSMDDYEAENNLCTNHTVTVTVPFLEIPEYYVAVGLISTAMWIAFPFLLYNPVKYMRRIFYLLGPSLSILLVAIAASMTHRVGLASFHNSINWRNFVEPTIWHDALTQALWTSQVAGGFLVPIGDTVYSSTNVQWTALILIGANILTSWLGTLLWFAITNFSYKDNVEISLLIHAQNAANERQLPKEWPLVLFVAIFLSGLISLITLLYPLYDRFSRMGGDRWRFISIALSFVGIIVTIALLALHHLPTLHVLDKIVEPFLISFSTLLEITAFVFIYGWKTFVGDIEFLSNSEINNFWILGWCATPGVVIPFIAWWMAKVVVENTALESIALMATAAFGITVFVFFALVTISRQEQYDCVSKLLTSFKPSRHWGPRDPITHYCWLARREEDRCSSHRCYHRRHLSQQRDLPISVISSYPNYDNNTEKKQRSHSDDTVYTVYRRQHLKDDNRDFHELQKHRPKSLDWDLPAKLSESNVRYVTNFRPFHRRKRSRIDSGVPIDMNRISHRDLNLANE